MGDTNRDVRGKRMSHRGATFSHKLCKTLSVVVVTIFNDSANSVVTKATNNTEETFATLLDGHSS